jgi:hypothetical protein
MPRFVGELTQGNSFSRSSDGGGQADSAVRKWRVLLGSPEESWDIFQTIGVNIGDQYSAANPIPCVSVSSQMEGDSRLIAIVTAEYRSSPSAAPTAADPKTQEPTVRPALYSMTTSLTEIAAWTGKKVSGGASGSWVPACNPVGDMYDGLTRLEPVVTINIDQYSSADESQVLQYVGYVNQGAFMFSNLSIPNHCCMLQGVSSTPVVEQFNGQTFRGFKITFSFGVRMHWAFVEGGMKAIGWDMALPQTGFNIINTGLGDSSVDQKALVLEHKDGKVYIDPAGDVQLATGTSNTKARAMVTVPATGSESGGYVQRPCAQPIALNDNGSPRNADNYGISEKVLVYQVCMQPEMAFNNNFSAFGIRWFS